MLTATGEVKQLSFWEGKLGRFVVILIRGSYLQRIMLSRMLYNELQDNFSPVLMSLEKSKNAQNLLITFEDKYITYNNIIIVDDWKNIEDKEYIENNGFYDVITLGVYLPKDDIKQSELDEVFYPSSGRRELEIFVKDFIKKYFTKGE